VSELEAARWSEAVSGAYGSGGLVRGPARGPAGVAAASAPWGREQDLGGGLQESADGSGAWERSGARLRILGGPTRPQRLRQDLQ